jgi:hypothetical protein
MSRKQLWVKNWFTINSILTKFNYLNFNPFYIHKKKVKISLLQAMEAPRVARGCASHIT